ncbi:MAG: RluA family pseudouridine synthase [Nitrospirae bacterium]|nr:RluA family pseudouridine synthase [Nitrospirota bacterium]
MITEFHVTEGEKRKRLDVFLVHREPKVTRSAVQRLIERGRIRINAQVVKPSHLVKPGDTITMDVPQPGELQVNGEALALEVLYEDEAILVVNKPAGVVVHPTSGNWSGTLVNAVLAHLQNVSEGEASIERRDRVGIVHRLDKHTSGVMVVAKTNEAHRSLSAQFMTHDIARTYEALLWGIPQEGHGKVALAIGRDTNNPKIFSTQTREPKAAITDFEVLGCFGDVASHVSLTPHTGRPHQLRVHMQSLGCPILGDSTYGGKKVCEIIGITIPRVMLHASSLGFHHPTSVKFQKFSIGFSADINAVLRSFSCKS